MRLRILRAALSAERCRGIHPCRDRGQGPQARDRPSAPSPDLRVRVLADGSVGAAGAPAVRQHALRGQRVGVLPLRALCLFPHAQRRRGVDVRPGTGDIARDVGQQCPPFHAAVRAALRGDPRAPEHRDPASCRRDLLARAGVAWKRPLGPRLAVGLGQQRRDLFHH